MFRIRDGVKEDCIAIEAMIKELAIYEKMPNEPKIDHKILETDGFGQQKLFWTLVAELVDSREVVGYSLFFYKYSTWNGKCLWMEDIYVKPQYRQLGIGRSLLTAVANFADNDCCDRLEWNCLDWNQSSICFYKKFGAIDLTETGGWHVFRLNRQQLRSIANSSDK